MDRKLIFLILFLSLSFKINDNTIPEHLKVSKFNVDGPVYVPISFPGAVGFGKYASGGKGGSVLFVTNLNNSGSGSLRAACEASGARTVVFRVGGTITLTSPIQIDNPNITIAGHTAPGGGILVKGQEFRISTSNVILRHMRFRMGFDGEKDALRMMSDSGSAMTDIMIDHCSMSWATDENFSISVVGTSGVIRNVTLQNCIIGEAGYGTLLTHRIYDTTLYHNYYAHNTDRNVRVGGYSDQAEPYFDLRAEVVNNIFYGMTYAVNQTYGTKSSFIGNIYKTSTAIPTLASGAVYVFTTSGEYTGYRSHTEIYLNDNTLIGSGSLESAGIAEYKVVTPYNSSAISAISSATLETGFFDGIGASLPLRDAVDTRLISEYATGGGSTGGTKTYPTISGGTPYTDSDSDGMDDSWETTNFGDLSKGNNGFDLSADYTNLQMFLSYLAGDEGSPVPTCSDGIQNGDETGIDCGGSCSPCGGIEPNTSGTWGFMNYLLTN